MSGMDDGPRRDRPREADECSPLLPNRPASTADSASTAVDDAESTGWTTELWLLTKYSLPLIATYLLQYSFFVITTIVAGHLGPDDLAAASVGVTTMNVIGLAIYEGMATALDTLCAQAYGSGNHVGVGLHLQRMLLLMGVVTIPIGALWLSTPWVLPLFVRQHDLAVRAGSFLRYSLVGLPGYGAFEALKRFTQAQGDCNAGMVVLIVCAPANALLSWLLAFPLGMGLEGAALGAALSNNLRFVLLLLYIVSPWGRWSHSCWGGFSREALQRWGSMMSLSLAGVTATLAEWGAFEILTLSTSYISTSHLAAQTILVSIWRSPNMSCVVSACYDFCCERIQPSLENILLIIRSPLPPKLDNGHCDSLAYPVCHQRSREHQDRIPHRCWSAADGPARHAPLLGRVHSHRHI